MQAGGANAISFYQVICENKFYEYIEELEYKLGREVKPFNLYIDIIYTGVIDVLDLKNDYMIVTPNGYINLSKKWWMKKLMKLIE